MKTKYLFTMGAMAALFAACADDYEVAQNGFDKVANRPSAGNVVLNTTFGEEGGFDADTRVIWDNGFKFQENDRIGAFLFDEFNETNIGSIADYTFVDYNQTNYPFQTTDEGRTWKTPDNAALCEGNYFFTMRYESAYKDRAYVEFSVPGVQKNYNEETGEHDVYADYAELQQRLGYAFIPATTEDVNEVSATFVPIFASPGFKIMNHTGLTLKVMKLIVRTHQHGPAGMPSKMPTTVVLAPKGKQFSTVQAEYPDMSVEDKALAMVSNAVLVKNGFFADTDADTKIDVDENDGVYEYVVDMGDNYMVKHGSNIVGQLVMPAGNYVNFDVYALVQVQDDNLTTGIISLTNLKNAAWSGLDTQNGSMDVDLRPQVGKLPKQMMTATIDAGAIGNLGLKDFAVTNTEDLMFVLNLMAKEGGNHNITVKTLGDQVELTNDVYAILSDPKWSNNKLQIDGTIVIPASLESNDGIDILWTDNKVKTTIINRGIQVLDEDLVADVINEGSLTEADDKDVTITGDVTNKGTLKVNKIEGDLNAEAGNAEVAVVESGVVTVSAGAEATISKAAGTVVNNGKVTTAGTILNELTNNEGGVWIVNDDLHIDGSTNSVNAGTMYVNEGVVITTNGMDINNTGVIENYGVVPVYKNEGGINNYAQGNLTIGENVKTINNFGVVEVSSANSGRINMKQKEADVFFSEYAAGDNAKYNYGSIENTVHGNIKNIPEPQHIIYTADGTKAMSDVLEEMAMYKLYTDLYITGDYTLKTGEDLTRTNTGGSNISKLADITIFKGATLIIDKENSVTVGYKGSIDVQNNGTIIISHSATMKGGDIINNGEIRKHNSGKMENNVVGGNDVIDFD